MMNFPSWPCSYDQSKQSIEDQFPKLNLPKINLDKPISDSALNKIMKKISSFKEITSLSTPVQPTLFDSLLLELVPNPFKRLEMMINQSPIPANQNYIEHSLELTFDEVSEYIINSPVSLEEICNTVGIDQEGIALLSLSETSSSESFQADPFAVQTYTLTMRKTTTSVFKAQQQKGVIIGGFDLDDVYSPKGDIPFPKEKLYKFEETVSLFEKLAETWNTTPDDCPF